MILDGFRGHGSEHGLIWTSAQAHRVDLETVPLVQNPRRLRMTRSQVQLAACDDEHGLSGERTGPGDYFLDAHVQSSADRPATTVRLPNGSDAFRETVGDILESENDGRLVGVGHYSYLYAASPWEEKPV